MTADLDAAARALYDACPSVKPDWSQLGEATRSVWRERVAPPAPSSPAPAPRQADLFSETAE